jgi:hypothetical protein
MFCYNNNNDDDDDDDDDDLDSLVFKLVEPLLFPFLFLC